nr:MAG TPA: hypothetical protein [Caudoviricetes sp.]
MLLLSTIYNRLLILADEMVGFYAHHYPVFKHFFRF